MWWLLSALLACTPETDEPTTPAGPTAATPPHVVLVVACTLRADQTPPWGGTVQMPWLSSFAEQGSRAERLLSVAPWTRPAIGTLFTGQIPEAIGLADPGPQLSQRALPDSVDTLAERFQDAGYRTLGVVANGNVRSLYGFGQGYDAWEPPNISTSPPPGDAVVDQLLRMAGRNPTKPTLLTAVLVDAHKPGNVDKAEVEAERAQVPAAPMVARYRAQLKRLDRALSLLDHGLAERGYDPNNTLWVVVGDHGEGLRSPRHHGPAHGSLLYDTSLHVPWLVRGPGIERGGTIDGLMSSVDVAPTLASLAGLPALGDGLDHSARFTGEDPSPSPREEAFARTWHVVFERGAVYTDGGAFCVKDFDPEAVEQANAERPDVNGPRLPNKKRGDGCTDLRTDPTALQRAPNPPLMAALEARQAEVRQILDDSPRVEVDPDEAVLRSLRELGYLD